jgi:TRAP-type mannitol/chloroaromatic compound transport system permease small subunit
MQTGIKHVTDGASCLVRVIGHVAAWSALALVLVVAFNVLARYLFSYGTVALQEAEWHIMAVSALFGMSYGLNQGGEVRVDIFYGTMRSKTQALVDFVSNIALFAIALIIAWLCIAYVQSSYVINEGSPDPGGLGYRYLLKASMPLAFVLLAVQAVAMTGHAALKLMTPSPERQE